MEVRRNETARTAYLQQMNTILHDLCQPLTTLQCRLEVAQLIGTPEEYREAVQSGAAECTRLAKHVHSLREIVRSLLADAETGAGRGED